MQGTRGRVAGFAAERSPRDKSADSARVVPMLRTWRRFQSAGPSYVRQGHEHHRLRCVFELLQVVQDVRINDTRVLGHAPAGVLIAATLLDIRDQLLFLLLDVLLVNRRRSPRNSFSTTCHVLSPVCH